MTSDWLLVLPIIIPLLSGVLCYLLPQYTAKIAITGAFLLLISTLQLGSLVMVQGIQVVNIGGWPAPFGIVFVADTLSMAMTIITAIIGFAVMIYAYKDIQSNAQRYYSLMHILLAAVSGAFLTGDIFNLYVWFEVMLTASFGLLTIEAKPKQLKGAIQYIAINLVATLSLLLAIAFLYGYTGTLNMADLHIKLQTLPESPLPMIIASLLLVAFAIKAALFPVFAWLPAIYPLGKISVIALFAGLLTKVGTYALLRLFTLLFPLNSLDGSMQTILLIISGLTMLTGVLAAASRFSIQSILSFHIISQIGYIVMGLAIYTPLAIAGSIFYTLHHIIVKSNLFLIAGVLQKIGGSDYIKDLGGFYKNTPFLAFLFIIPAFSLAGFPPLSGFWAKFLVIKASIDAQIYWLAGIALLVGLLTVYSMTKIWQEVFWKAPVKSYKLVPKRFLYLPIVSLVLLTLFISFSAEFLFTISKQASEELLNPNYYVNKVLAP